MNAARRRQIAQIVEALNGIADTLLDVRAEEQVALENMPENLQASAQGQTMDQTIDTLQDICDRITEAATELQEVAEE